MVKAAGGWMKPSSPLEQWLMTSRDRNLGQFSTSQIYEKKMVQFEPEIVQNITVRQHKKQVNDKPKRPAGGDARGKYSLLHSISCI